MPKLATDSIEIPTGPRSSTLECWPPFPLVVKYGGFLELDPPALKDDDNIITSLKQSGRVNSINLTVTSSLIEKLPAVTEPLSGPEELVLLSRDNVHLTLPSGFRWVLVSVLSTRPGSPLPHSRGYLRYARTSLIFSSTKFLVSGIFPQKRSRMPCPG